MVHLVVVVVAVVVVVVEVERERERERNLGHKLDRLPAELAPQLSSGKLLVVSLAWLS